MRKQVFLISSVVLALILIVMEVGCGAPPDKVVTVGNKDFTEQYIYIFYLVSVIKHTSLNFLD